MPRRTNQTGSSHRGKRKHSSPRKGRQGKTGHFGRNGRRDANGELGKVTYPAGRR